VKRKGYKRLANRAVRRQVAQMLRQGQTELAGAGTGKDLHSFIFVPDKPAGAGQDAQNTNSQREAT
jgi:hypothetical protein